MMQSGMTAIVVAVAIYSAFCAFMYATQRNSIYFPTPEVYIADVGNMRLASEGETLKIWQLANAGGSNAIIYFGGNAEDVSGNIPGYVTMFPRHDVYIVNYRGFGGSTGSPTEAALYKDALAVFDEIRSRYTDISVIGRSLGSGVATYLATARDIDNLILVTPFDSLENIAKKAMPILPVSLLLKDKFDSVGRVADITAPVLVVIAENDDIISRQRSDALVAAFPDAQVSVEIIPDTAHNTVSLSPRYTSVLSMYLNDRAN